MLQVGLKHQVVWLWAVNPAKSNKFPPNLMSWFSGVWTTVSWCTLNGAGDLNQCWKQLLISQHLELISTIIVYLQIHKKKMEIRRKFFVVDLVLALSLSDDYKAVSQKFMKVSQNVIYLFVSKWFKWKEAELFGFNIFIRDFPQL